MTYNIYIFVIIKCSCLYLFSTKPVNWSGLLFISMSIYANSTEITYRDNLGLGKSYSHGIVSIIKMMAITVIWASSRETLSLGFPTNLDSNKSAQLQRLARKFTFRLKQV